MVGLLYLLEAYDSNYDDTLPCPLSEEQMVMAAPSIFDPLGGITSTEVMYIFSYAESYGQIRFLHIPGKGTRALTETGYIEITNGLQDFLTIMGCERLENQVHRIGTFRTAKIQQEYGSPVSISLCTLSTLLLPGVTDPDVDPIGLCKTMDTLFIHRMAFFICDLPDVLNIHHARQLANVLVNSLVLAPLQAHFQSLSPLHLRCLTTFEEKLIKHDLGLQNVPLKPLVHSFTDFQIDEQSNTYAEFNNKSPTLLCPPSLFPLHVAPFETIELHRNMSGRITSPDIYLALALLELISEQ
ncbi:hypothetical protein GMRT_15380 [Giardia muris]|uniref:Uncharacterized protein n=1 Tax=Giardia muris TaxID=5742 RepID=A0A4Z1SYG8_GIAMU|nr:hypothetical protein GMRT_15380 [Giardia muris]|eukprot:TNJ30734.1 hypothetical protein GMRT_15380 [Giardia muris]